MSKKISRVLALVGLCALSLFLLNCGSSSSRPSGLLYVLTQGTNEQGIPGIGNDVSSFSIDFDNGSLSLINSNASTCPAGNNTNTNPCGIPLDIVLDPTGLTAFVLDQGVPCVLQGTQCVSGSANPIAPSIYPYTVNSDGSLSNPGTPVTWTCINVPAPCTGYDTALAMTRDAAGQFLFVIDEGVYPQPLGCPAVGTPDPSNPIYTGCPSITVFAMTPGSTTLTPASGSPFYLSKTPSALSAIAFTPPNGTAQELLFVTNNYDLCTVSCDFPPSAPGPASPNDNTVSVYSVSSSGVLAEQQYSPYVIAATDPVSVIAVYTNQTGEGENTGGLFVYVGQGGSGGALFPFQICTVINAVCTQADVASNLMVPLATCPQISCNVPPTSAGQGPFSMLVDPTNSFLYVASQGSNQVFGFLINTGAGKLTALSGSPQYSQGSQPVSIALHPSVNNTGQFLFVSNSTSQTIGGFTLSTTTGSMSSPTSTITPAAPSGMAAP
jgi:hypothetical protein